MLSNQATQGNTALKVHHHSDSDYNTGVPFALSNGGVILGPQFLILISNTQLSACERELGVKTGYQDVSPVTVIQAHC